MRFGSVVKSSVGHFSKNKRKSSTGHSEGLCPSFYENFKFVMQSE